jgi:hypothetical protein
VSHLTDEVAPIADPDVVHKERSTMMEPGDLDSPFDAFSAAQAGAVAHLETMSQATREVMEDVMASDPLTSEARSRGNRLSEVADLCDAFGLQVARLDIPEA